METRLTAGLLKETVFEFYIIKNLSLKYIKVKNQNNLTRDFFFIIIIYD